MNAGADQNITLPSSASLSATVSDDGLPTGTLTRNWTRASGPGTVTFSAPNGATTHASFSVAGTYVLRLTASDGALSGSDDVAMTVSGPAASGVAGGRMGLQRRGGHDTRRQFWQRATRDGVTGATWTTGRYGQALNFDGNDSGDPGAISDLTGSFTVMAWMQTRSLHASGCASLVMKALDYGFEICQGRFMPAVGNGSSWTANPSQPLTSADLNVWKHVTLTHDGTTLRFYIGGTLVTSVAGAPRDEQQLLLFGRWAATTASSGTGSSTRCGFIAAC